MRDFYSPFIILCRIIPAFEDILLTFCSLLLFHIIFDTFNSLSILFITSVVSTVSLQQEGPGYDSWQGQGLTVRGFTCSLRVFMGSPTINILWCVPLAIGHWVIDLELVPGCPPIPRDKCREQVSIRCAEYDCM